MKKDERCYQRECKACGEVWISASSSCPKCGAFVKAGEEFTKKVINDNDLRKAF